MKNKNLLIIRYINLCIIILGVTLTEVQSFSTFSIIITLIFIINNQLRYFLFSNISSIVFLSIFLDFIFGYILYTKCQGLLLPYFIIGITDSLFLIKNFSRYIISFLGIIILLYAGKDLSIEQLLSFLASMVSLIFISDIIGKEHNNKLKLEDLYHRLKLSEENLIKTNRELEIYADSIRDLSILKERNRISREIHDSVGHSLSTIIIQLGAIEKIGKSNGEAASLMASNLKNFAKNGLEEIRKALRELKPKEFQEYESLLIIENLIKDFNKLTGIDVKFGFSKNKWQINEETSLVLYRAIQEFLSNSAKHGKATKINIFLHFGDDLILTLQDNGVGTNIINRGIGLTSISERVNELGGSISYESRENNGFLLRIVLKAVNGGKYHEEN